MNIRRLNFGEDIRSSEADESLGCGIWLAVLSVAAFALPGLALIGFLVAPESEGPPPEGAHIVLPVCGVLFCLAGGLLAYFSYRYFNHLRTVKTKRRKEWAQLLGYVDERAKIKGCTATDVLSDVWPESETCSVPLPPENVTEYPHICCQCAGPWKVNSTDSNYWIINYGNSLVQFGVMAAFGTSYVSTTITLPVCDKCMAFQSSGEWPLPPLLREDWKSEDSENMAHRIKMHGVHNGYVAAWKKLNPNGDIRSHKLQFELDDSSSSP